MHYMESSIEALGVYLHLAAASHRRNQPLVRSRLLVLCGVMAYWLGLDGVADHCRTLVLDQNQSHLLGRFADFDAALADDEFIALLRQLYRRYPREKAEQMLASLGIDPAGERATYYTDLEYAASLLGVSPAQLTPPDEQS